MLRFTLTASEADAWLVKSIKVKASGSGNDHDDISRVWLWGKNGQIGGAQTFSQDDGEITFPIDPPITIPPSGAELFYLYCDFKKLNDCPEEKKEFQFTVSLNTENTTAVTYPPGSVLGHSVGTVFMGCGAINVDRYEWFDTIQEAVAAADESNTIEVCPGTYKENIKIDKSLNLVAKKGRLETFIEWANPDAHVIEITSLYGVVVEGFTIKGATGVEKAGIYMSDNLEHQYHIYQFNRFMNNNLGLSLNSAKAVQIKNNYFLENQQAGIYIENVDDDETIISNNEIKKNSRSGVYLKDCKGVVIRENSQVAENDYGIFLQGCDSIKIGNNKIANNGKHGIYLKDSRYSRIMANEIIKNASCGILIDGDEAKNNEIFSNFIGTDFNSEQAYPNEIGVHITNRANGNIIGIENIISGNKEAGILISEYASRNKIIGNKIGTRKDGKGRLPNGLAGIRVTDADSNTIGGLTEVQRNIISGNEETGVYISGNGSYGNVVIGNFIGTDISGEKSLANGVDGVKIVKAANNRIGDKLLGRNIISGNEGLGVDEGFGVDIEDGRRNIVIGNYIGTNKEGTKKLSNLLGIRIICTDLYKGCSHENTIKGNLISGNKSDGIFIQGSGWNNISGNFIGTDWVGLRALPNLGNGIAIENSSFNIIGGATANERNIISGNIKVGVAITGNENMVLRNYIGTGLRGSESIGNNIGVKIYFGGSNNLVANNKIHHNCKGIKEKMRL